MTTIAELDAASPAEFVHLLDGIYEHSPWVPARAAPARPFHNIAALHAALQSAVLAADEADQLALIRAHPELIGKLAPSDAVTDQSRSEQASAGLDRSTEDQMAQMRELNRIYRERFGFPFIIAVRGMSRDDIVAQLLLRSQRERTDEFEQCISEIGKIAAIRLDRLITG